MQARPLKDDGCTVVDAPYKEEDLDASKLGVDTSFPVLRSPWLKVASDFVKAPVYSTFITPNSPWLVPLMFGPNITGTTSNQRITWIGSAEGESALSFASSKENSDIAIDNGRWEYQRSVLTFDASKANTIYGATSMVQPSSMRFLACIKV